MAILAQLEQQSDGTNRRGSPRRRLLLEAAGPADAKVVIHDLSRTGLLIETSVSLSAGVSFQVQLPEAGTAQAEIVWNSGRFFGCRFKEPISNAVLSAALLRSPASPPGEHRTSSHDRNIALEIELMSARVQQLTGIVDDILDDLLRERRREHVENSRVGDATAPKVVHDVDPEIADEVPVDDRLSFGMRLRIILAMAIGSWALILWAFGLF